MTTTHVAGLDESIHKTNIWLKELKEELGLEDHQGAYTALRATLHAIRDRLSTGEAADLASQLPTLIRGAYYENWVPDADRAGRRSRESFLGQIRDTFRPPPGEEPRIDPEAAVHAVTALLDRHVTEGQMQHVRSTLPEEIRELVGGAA